MLKSKIHLHSDMGVKILTKGYTSTNESLTVLKGTSMPGRYYSVGSKNLILFNGKLNGVELLFNKTDAYITLRHLPLLYRKTTYLNFSNLLYQLGRLYHR